MEQQPQQMPASQQANVPGEAAIPQQTVQQVSPDVASPQGQQQLFQKAVQAHVVKKTLDAVLQAVAGHIGATTESRVKQIETMASKVTQHRLEGKKSYGIDDLNDTLGARIIVDSEAMRTKAKKSVEKLSEAGVFKINKQEPVKLNDYSAYHFDITISGLKAEIQIMDKKEEATSLINHGIRALHGQNPANDAVVALRNKQADIINKMPDEKAQAVSQAVKSINQQNGSKPIDPRITASVLAQAQQ